MKSYHRRQASIAKQLAQVGFVWLSLGAAAGVPAYCSLGSDSASANEKIDPTGKDIEQAVAEAEARAQAARTMAASLGK
jgi:hypothetical protein